MLLDQSKRQIALFSPLGAEQTDLALRAFTITEELGRIFRIDADLLSENTKLKFTDIVGQSVTIRMNTIQSKPRFWNGHVRSFRQVGNVGRLARYQAIIVPKLWFLTRSADCRIFQNKTVPDIITEVLAPYNFTHPFENTLTADYQPWEYCVQYRETDFNFISRLMEQEGIHYYFRHENGKHTMVLADLNSVHLEFPAYATIPFIPPEAQGVDRQSIQDWTVSMEVQPSSYLLNDFDFKKPKASLVSHSVVLTPQVENGEHEIFDYPGEYTEQHDGDRYSMARIHELNTSFELAYGESNARGLSAGCNFTLRQHTRDDANGSYLVISTVIKAEAESYFSDGGTPDTPPFTCSCTALKTGDVSFVPARLTPKPMIQGTQTAIVTGPKGDEIYTDKYGRIKVQFHWDRQGKHDANTTLFIRVAEAWAGKRWGSTFTPRIGQEVVVTFLEGDPDQPLIIGSVYNGEQMPPYLGDGPDPKHKNDPNVSGVKSCSTKGGQGFNEWRFDDTKGKEQIFTHAEKDMDIRVRADMRTDVGGSTNLTVGFQDAQGELHGFIKEKIFRTKVTHALRTIEEIADRAHGTFVGQESQYRQVINSEGNFAAEAKQVFSVKAGTVIIEADADSQISLKCGESFIVLKPDGVYINGAMLYLNSGGSPAETKAVPPRALLEPDHADNSKSGSPSISGGQEH